MIDPTKMMHLEKYLDTIELVPMELARSFGKINEINVNAQETVNLAKKLVSKFLDNFREMDKEERTEALKTLNKVFNDMLIYGEKKVDVAVEAYCTVVNNIRELDESLSKFEEEEFMGPSYNNRKLRPTTEAPNETPTHEFHYNSQKSKDGEESLPGGTKDRSKRDK